MSPAWKTLLDRVADLEARREEREAERCWVVPLVASDGAGGYGGVSGAWVIQVNRSFELDFAPAGADEDASEYRGRRATAVHFKRDADVDELQRAMAFALAFAEQSRIDLSAATFDPSAAPESWAALPATQQARLIENALGTETTRPSGSQHTQPTCVASSKRDG